MTIDYAHPLPADLYDSATQPDVLEYIRDNVAANAKWLEGMDPAGKQTGFKRINSGLLEEWNGTAWVAKALGYVPKTGATDITGNLILSVADSAYFAAKVPNAPVDKRVTGMAGDATGNSFFGRLTDAISNWTAGMRIGADGKVYDIASGLPFVTTDPVGAYLPLTGGTLNGSLTVSGGTISITGSAGTPRILYFLTAGSNRWVVQTNVGAETGGNVGSPFSIDRFSDTGTYLGTPFTINRNDGWATFGNNVTVNGLLTCSAGANFTGNVNMNSGQLAVNASIELGSSAPGQTPFIDFHSCTTAVNDFDGRIICSGGTAGSSSQGTMNYQCATNVFNGEIAAAGQIRSDWGYKCKNGVSGAYGTNSFNIYYDVSGLWIVIDNLKLKITIPALFADEEIAKAKPQALEPKWFDTLQPQVALSSSELMPDGKQAGLIPGDPEPSLLLGQMILQIQDLKRRVSVLEGV